MSVDLAPPRGISTLHLQLRRFRQNRLAMASVVVLALIVALCFLGPYAFPFTGEDADFDFISAPATFTWPHLFGTDAASYTHLDVYKRQIQTLRHWSAMVWKGSWARTQTQMSPRSARRSRWPWLG